MVEKFLWTKNAPVQAGYYWMNEPSNKYFTPIIVRVADAVDLSEDEPGEPLGWEGLKRYEWAGPISLPDEREVGDNDG